MRGPTALAALGAAAHLICKIAFISEGRFFASEDDPYRAYTAFLIKDDPIRIIGRLWVLGFESCHALLQGFGVPARWAGIGVNLLVFAALLVGLWRLMEELSQGRASLKWSAAALLLASPMTITLAHSSLSDLLATCLIVWAAEGFIVYASECAWFGNYTLVVLVGQHHHAVDEVAENSHQLVVVSRLVIFPGKVIVLGFRGISTEDIA